MKLCDYGCGQEAHFQLKNGKWCCSKHWNSCPQLRKKNSEGCKKSFAIGKRNAREIWHNMSDEAKKRWIWNKGLTKKTSKVLSSESERIKQKYASGELTGSFRGHKHSEESKKKISLGTSRSYNYDVNRKSGRGRKGYYKGFYCASTYELAYVIYCLDHNIQIERCKEYFEYEYQGQKHRYYPDFVVNDEIVEIKGFWNGRVNAKRDAVLLQNKKYKILFPKDMDFIFKYIEEKYGKLVNKNISDLYEKWAGGEIGETPQT